jgi:predicted nucleic acid-binding protein
LISPHGPPAAVFKAFLHERFTLVKREEQLDELKRVTRQTKLRRRLRTQEIG